MRKLGPPETKAERAVRIARERVVRAAKRYADLGTQERQYNVFVTVGQLRAAERALRAERRRGRGR